MAARRDPLQDRAQAMLDWLEGLGLEHGGAIPSWTNPDHAGYAYPEAAGLWLSAVAQARPDSPALAGTAAWLARQVDARGYVGRRGRAYVFDSAMALSGLFAARAAGGVVDAALLARMAQGQLAAVGARWAADPRPCPPEGEDSALGRWSERWACHQLKLAWALGRCGPAELPAAERARALGALETLGELEHEGRFVLAPDDSRSYVHASCYALEGLLALRRDRREEERARLDARLRRGADWLASIQEPDGALPCWVAGPGEVSVAEQRERRPSDIIAQAVRIWVAVDPGRHDQAIRAGLHALARRQHPSGALSYLEGSADLNSWCTVFALQALRAVLAQRSGSPGDRWLA